MLTPKNTSETAPKTEEDTCQKMEVDCVREFMDVDSGIENMDVEELKEMQSPNEVLNSYTLVSQPSIFCNHYGCKCCRNFRHRYRLTYSTLCNR